VAIVGPLLKPTNSVILLTRELKVYQYSFLHSGISSIGDFYQSHKKELQERWPALYQAMILNTTHDTRIIEHSNYAQENASRQLESTNKILHLPQHFTGLTVTGEGSDQQYMLLSWSHDNHSKPSNWTNWSWFNLKSAQMTTNVSYNVSTYECQIDQINFHILLAPIGSRSCTCFNRKTLAVLFNQKRGGSQRLVYWTNFF
jgi:hypothetical protein